MSVHRKYNSKLQQTRCNVSWFIYFYRRSTCFRRFLRPSSGARNCTYIFRYCQTILLIATIMDEMERSSISGLLTAFEQDQDGTSVSSWSCSQAVSKHVWHIPLMWLQWKTPDGGQRNCLKHAEFHSKITLRN